MTEEVEGPVVGSISSSAVAAAERYIRGGAQYDFAIGGLPFLGAISDERPYARETADFRKQQIDQSSTVGDQSLTGYWTRGQSSFHRGQGIRFYEVLEGDTITSRFADGLDVDVWTVGQVKLKPLLSLINATATVDAVIHGTALAIQSSAGAVSYVTYAGAATAKPSTTADPFTAITSDGTNTYGAVGNRIEKLTGTGSFSVLWTHGTGGRTWSKIWWAKDRLWAVDNTGEWYTLSTIGGTTSGSDVLWTSSRTGVRWSLAEGEGGVYIAGGHNVFLSALDTTTASPTLIVPVAVASVGAQETISTIGSYLGYLAVASDAGLRMGQVQSGGVALGNTISTADFSQAANVSYRKNLVQIAGLFGTNQRLLELNVLEQITELQGAYSVTRQIGTSTTTPHGSLVLPDGRTLLFGSTGLRLESASVSAATGTIQTGYHRLGTLEPKDFRTVSVRAEGVGGSVAVEKVLRDGTTVSLVTLGVANFYDNEIALNLTGPTDFIALRFTLAPDADGNVPTLLGYQLRALPAPKRQRLMQVPLHCFNVEKVGKTTYGYKGWAKDRLFALETLEESSAVIRFQDFTLDETCFVSVERVQFQRKTPTKNGDDGFGGYVVLTLRKVT